MITELNNRTRIVFEQIVDSYLNAGGPVGSRTLSRLPGLDVSPATIRNIMADLADMGLITAPHVSAGRMPTPQGLRLFIDGLMQIGDLPGHDDRSTIESRVGSRGQSGLPNLFEDAVSVLSGLSSCAGMVIAPKRETPIKQIQFVAMPTNEILAVLVFSDGMVENRLLKLDEKVTPSALEMASNFLTAQIAGKTLGEARSTLLAEISKQQNRLDALTRRVVEAGLAEPSSQEGILIVKGTANLLENVSDLEQIRELMGVLEDRQSMLRLLEKTEGGQGMQIFIGAENPLFDASGLSMIVAPTHDQNNRMVGAIGVIGPLHLNYGRIIPLVDYTAKVMSRLI